MIGQNRTRKETGITNNSVYIRRLNKPVGLTIITYPSYKHFDALRQLVDSFDVVSDSAISIVICKMIQNLWPNVVTAGRAVHSTGKSYKVLIIGTTRWKTLQAQFIYQNMYRNVCGNQRTFFNCTFKNWIMWTEISIISIQKQVVAIYMLIILTFWIYLFRDFTVKYTFCDLEIFRCF